MRVESEQPSFEVVLLEHEYDELKKCLVMEPESDNIVYGATYTKEGIVLRAIGEDLQDFADILAFNANHEESPKRQRILDQVLDRIKAVLGGWISS